MTTERDTPEIAHITEHSIPEILGFVLENSQGPILSDAIARLDLGLGVKAPPLLKEFEMHPEYYLKIPRYFEIQPSKPGERTLTVGYKTTAEVNITWHQRFHRINRIEKPWREDEGQNWIQYDNHFSASLMKEDPWIAKIDRELFSEMDQSDSLDDKRRGNLVLVSHRPAENRSLQILYHFDIYGETRSYRWLTARVIEHPGLIQEVVHNKQMPLPGATEQIDGHRFKQYLSVDEMVRNILVPDHSYKMKGESFSRKNLWGIQVVS